MLDYIVARSFQHRPQKLLETCALWPVLPFFRFI